MGDIELLVSKVLDLETRVVKLEKLLAEKKESHVVPVKKLSIKEFLLHKKSSNDTQKALAVAYYLEKNERMSSFNVDDLARYYKLAKEPKPKNLNHKMILNIRNGHLMETEEKKEKKKTWTLTNAGEQFVENNFKK